MRIVIEQDDYILTVSNDNLDNDCFVNLKLAHKHLDNTLEADFSLRDLMPALIAFDAKRSKRLSEESEMK